MTRSSLFLLGPPSLERPTGTPLELDTRKALALVAYLAASRGSHTRDSLAGLLWPEYGQSKARAALRRTLSALRTAREDGWLKVDRNSVGLVDDGLLWVDLHRFRERLAECLTHGHPTAEVCPRCLPPLAEAANLCRGEFMAGFGLRDSVEFDDWQLHQGEILRAELADALDRLARGHEDLGDWTTAIAHARRRLVLDPLHEPAHVALMRLYAFSARRADALKQYRDCARLLDRELGVPPLEETTALYRTIKDGGLPRPVPSEKVPPARVRAPRQNPLVGRKKEWEALLRAYGAAKGGGHVAIVEGEAGIGKTRLAEEFLDRVARAGGARIIAARCYPGQANLAYGPIFEALSPIASGTAARERLAEVPKRRLVEASRLLPGLLADGETPAPPLEGPGARSRFFEGVVELLLALAGARSPDGPPGVLFLDDLQWMDGSSLDLLSYLVRRLVAPDGEAVGGLLVLLAWRAEETPADRRLRVLLAEMVRADAATRLYLGRLDRDDTLELARAAGASEALGERLYGETEGLPLFLHEYLAAIMRGTPGAADAAANWGLPGGVRDLLEGQLRSVNETGRQVLAAAAVLGRSFDFDAVREASGRGEEEAIEALEALVAAGMVREVRGGEAGEGSPLYDFGHDKLRALVYEETSQARRRLLHLRIAVWLARRSRRGGRIPGPSSASIAHHYRLAGQDGEAARYFRLAGDHARSLYANRDALAHYEAALTLGGPEGPEEIALREAVGDLHTTLGEYAMAIESYEATVALAEGETLARIERKLGNVHVRRGDVGPAESHYEAALAASVASGGGVEMAWLNSDRSLLAHRRGEPERARDLAEQALESAQAAGEPRALARARNVLGILAAGEGDRPSALRHLKESLSLAEELEDPDARVAALNNMALVYRDGAEVGKAIELAEAALALCLAVGDRHREAALRNNLADLLHAAGRDEESRAQIEKAVTLFAGIGEQDALRPGIWSLTEW